MQNGTNTLPSRHDPVYVLDGSSAEDVAVAMIEEGGQTAPFFLFDMDEVYKRIQYFRKMMPRVQVFYAMKANDWELALKMAASLGTGFDCASPGEISKLLQLNVNPESIIFAIPTKPKEWMKFARDAGVKHTTFDNPHELKKIKQYWPEANLLLRIRVDGESVYKLGLKFGCDFETEAIDLLEQAASLGLKVVGVAFHVGSCCFSFDSHMIGLRRAKHLFEHEAKAGRRMRIVDIGGGFLSDRIDSIDEVSRLVNGALEELFPDPEVQVIAEPGRYIIDSSTTHYNSVNCVRTIKDNNKNIELIYLNDGHHGTLRYMESHHIEALKMFKPHKGMQKNPIEISEDREIVLWGPTCDSTDQIMKNEALRLPYCNSNDWLVFPFTGAYTWGFAGPFSCLPIPLKRSVISKEVWSKIKDSWQFSPGDFSLNFDIAAPLPSQMPPIKKGKVDESPQTPVLVSV